MAWSKPEWNTPIGSQPKSAPAPKKRNPRLAGALAGLIVAVGALTAWLLLAPSAGPVPVSPAPKAVKPEKTPKPTPRAKPAPKPVAARPPPEPAKPELPKPDYVKKPGQMQLPDGRILTFPVPAEGEYRIVHSHGAMYKCDHLGNWEDVTPKPIFDNAFEENLVGLSVEGGSFIPGMLMGLDPKGVEEMLNKPVTVNPDDPEDVVEKKRAVAEMKGMILEYLRQGGTFDQFVMMMREATVQERKAKGTAMRDIVTLLKEGRTEDAAFYRKALDEQLKKEGMPPLKLPSHLDAALGH